MAHLGSIAGPEVAAAYRLPVVSPAVYPLRMHAGVVSQQPLSIDASGSLSGVARTAAWLAPLPGALVGLFHRSAMQPLQRTRTAADGTYQFSGLDRADLKAYFAVVLDTATTAPYGYSGLQDRLTPA